MKCIKCGHDQQSATPYCEECGYYFNSDFYPNDDCKTILVTPNKNGACPYCGTETLYFKINLKKHLR